MLLTLPALILPFEKSISDVFQPYNIYLILWHGPCCSSISLSGLMTSILRYSHLYSIKSGVRYHLLCDSSRCPGQSCLSALHLYRLPFNVPAIPSNLFTTSKFQFSIPVGPHPYPQPRVINPSCTLLASAFCIMV